MNQKMKTVLIVIGVGLIMLILIMPTVMDAISGRGPWTGGMMGGFGLMVLMPIVWIVVLTAIIWAVVTALRRPQTGGSDSGYRSESALEILKKRYARGEINKAEYEEKKKDLM